MWRDVRIQGWGLILGCIIYNGSVKRRKVRTVGFLQLSCQRVDGEFASCLGVGYDGQQLLVPVRELVYERRIKHLCH